MWSGEPESLLVTTDEGTRIHYLDWGAARQGPAGRPPGGLPPLVLVHGLSATAWSWAPVARRLAPLTHVAAPDLRGHGLSDSPRSGYDLDSLAFDALTVMSANGWGTDVGGPPAVVGGHGLGALVAVMMAALRPSSVAGLALIDAGWEDASEATGMNATEFERSIGDPPEVMASMEAYLADRRAFDPRSWDADQERAARSAVDQKHAGHVASVVRPHALRGAVGALFEFSPAILAALDVPTLICVAESGAADDDLVRERHAALADLVRDRVANGHSAPDVRRFPGAGHNLMRYRAEELSIAMRELLEPGHQRS